LKLKSITFYIMLKHLFIKFTPTNYVYKGQFFILTILSPSQYPHPHPAPLYSTKKNANMFLNDKW